MGVLLTQAMNMQISLHIIKPRHVPFGDTSLDQSLPRQKIVPTTSNVMSMIRHAVFNCWTMMPSQLIPHEPNLLVASSKPSTRTDVAKIAGCAEKMYGDLWKATSVPSPLQCMHGSIVEAWIISRCMLIVSPPPFGPAARNCALCG